MNLVHVFKIESIVKLSKLKDDVDNFGLIGTIQASVFFAIENSLAALKNQMRADWVFCFVC